MNATQLVAQLAAAGTQPELLAAVAEQLFKAEVELAALETIRKNARERKAKSREVTGQDVTSQEVTIIPSPLIVPPNVSPGPPSNTPPLTPHPDPIPDGMGVPAEPENDNLKPEHVIEEWNDIATRHGLPKIAKLTPERRRKLAARIKQNTVDEWMKALNAIERSAFLHGENDRGWRADFDFLLQPKSFTKLLEGAYDH